MRLHTVRITFFIALMTFGNAAHAVDSFAVPRYAIGKIVEAISSIASKVRRGYVPDAPKSNIDVGWRNSEIICYMILQEYKNGTLPHVGGAEHAKDIRTINMQVISSDDKSFHLHEDIQKYLAICTTPSHTERTIFWDSKKIDWETPEWRLFTTFHELAHALDKCGQCEWASKCYTWLKFDLEKMTPQERATIDPSELHADKQGIAWMKKYRPDDAVAFKQKLELWIMRGRTRESAYASYALMLEWLNDPKV